jgi:hypothetical protein
MNGPITKIQLDVLEKAIDKVFNKIGIDVEFTKHFLDRVNDPRNDDQISLRELGQLFVKGYKKWGRQIAKMPIDSQAVMKDLSTALNIPFVINKGKQGKDMIAKTIMRKQNFNTPDMELPVESINEELEPDSKINMNMINAVLTNMRSRRRINPTAADALRTSLEFQLNKHGFTAHIAMRVVEKMVERREDLPHDFVNAFMQSLADKIETSYYTETTTNEDRDPFSREVMVPGLGGYTVSTLQRTIENKLEDLHARAKRGDPHAFRQIAYLLKDPAFNAMLDALMKTYDKLATQTQHRKAFGEAMHNDTFSNVKSESINDYDIVKTNGKYLLMRSKNDDEYYIIAKKHNKGISAIANGAKVDDNEWEFSSIGKTSQGYGVSYHETPLEGFAEWTDDMFEDMHGAKKGSQVKGKEKTPSKSKPTHGGETSHPLRGRLVGEEDVKEMWDHFQLTDKIIGVRPRKNTGV